MQIRRFAIVLSLAVFSFGTFGCLTPRQIDTHVNEGRKNINEIPKAIYGAARAVPNANQGIIDTYEGEFEARLNAQASRLAELTKEIGQMEDFAKNLLTNIARVAAASAGIVVPAGASMEEIFSSAFNKVKDDAKASGEEGSKKIKEEVVAIAARLTGTEALLAEAREKLGLATKEQEWAQKELEKLSAEFHDKLAAVTTDTQEKLKVAMADRAEFERLLRDEAKLTPDEIENLKGFTTEQILALIAAATAAAGAGAVAGRSGRSRSQPEIDELYDKVGTISTAVAAVEGALAKPSTSNL